LRMKREKHDDPRNAEELVKDIVQRMQDRIAAYLNDMKNTSPGKRAIMENIALYLDNGDDEPLLHAIREYDKSWINWLASWFYSNEADKMYYAVIGMQKSPFFQKALRGLIKKKEAAKDLSEVSSEISEEMNLNESEREYEYDSHIIDFEESESRVNENWQTHRVTKDAIMTTLEQILADIQEFKQKNTVQLPVISLPKELVSEELSEEDKTVIEHIEDCVHRLQEKIKSDKSNSYFQTDCAFLQNAINRILNYQYQGNHTRKLLTEDQRSLYVEIGTKLTNDLNQTQKQPKKTAEVLNSVNAVRVEIHRLIKFHNTIREKLAQFQERLKQIDQGTFYNDIEDFLTNGLLDERQRELQDLLDSLKDCQDDTFNVLNPQGLPQTRVCNAVERLQAYGTSLVEALADKLLMQQNNDASVIQKRIYKNVNPKKDAVFASQFEDIMADVERYSNSLAKEESSRLGDFFTESNPAVQSNTGMSMFGSNKKVDKFSSYYDLNDNVDNTPRNKGRR
ncbi:MAG TPA: hypothetical protein VHD33_03080, partial [Legionellaceae bacterium]|nr:hypothetical protein [Legionellaceae bacterium]